MMNFSYWRWPNHPISNPCPAGLGVAEPPLGLWSGSATPKGHIYFFFPAMGWFGHPRQAKGVALLLFFFLKKKN
jgi:hypothetical protein